MISTAPATLPIYIAKQNVYRRVFITKPKVIFRLFLKDSDEAFPDCASLPFNLQGLCLQVIQVTPGQFTKPMPICFTFPHYLCG